MEGERKKREKLYIQRCFHPCNLQTHDTENSPDPARDLLYCTLHRSMEKAIRNNVA